MPDLKHYRAKRDPDRTPEPFGADAEARALPPVRRVASWSSSTRRATCTGTCASRVDGVLVSFAVPRGPSLDPAAEAARGADRGPPARVRGLRGRDPGRELRRGRDDRLGPRHLPQRGRSRAGGRAREGQARPRDRRPEAARALRARAHGRQGEAGPRVAAVHEGARLRAARHRGARAGVRVLGPHGARSSLRARRATPKRAACAEAAAAKRAARRREAAADARGHGRTPVLARGLALRAQVRRRAHLAEAGRGKVRLVRAHRRRAHARSIPRWRLRSRTCRSSTRSSTARSSRSTSAGARASSASSAASPRATRARPSALRREVPVIYYAFDLPRGLRASTCASCRSPSASSILAVLVPPRGLVRCADHVERRRPRAVRGGARARARGRDREARRLGLRGGRRSKRWLKIKVPRASCFVIVGVSPGQGLARGARLAHARRAPRRRARLRRQRRLGPRRDARSTRCCRRSKRGAVHEARVRRGCPSRCRAASWFVEPELVCEVRFTEMHERRLLRQPVFLGARDDVAPRDLHCAPRSSRGGRAAAGEPRPSCGRGARSPRPSSS